MEDEMNQNNNNNNSNNDYLKKVIEKYSFIEAIYVTDLEGVKISSMCVNPDNQSEEMKKIKNVLAMNYMSSHEQIAKVEKGNIRNVSIMFENHIVFQSRINKVMLVHFICKNENYNHEILKDIVDTLKKMLENVEKEFENLRKEDENYY
jgi:hypothetical protein